MRGRTYAPRWLIAILVLLLAITFAVVVVIVVQNPGVDETTGPAAASKPPETERGGRDGHDSVAVVTSGAASDTGKTTGSSVRVNAKAGANAAGEQVATVGDEEPGFTAIPGANESPLDLKLLLPVGPGLIPSAFAEGLIGNAREATRGTSANTSVEGAIKTEVFGVSGSGYKFVYVFDRSDSMGVPDDLPMAAARAELIGSLRKLGRTHQFQIIFFNHAEPVVFNPTGRPGHLVFGDEGTLRAAERFVASVKPSGGTRPEDALVMAINMRPEVIFFLSDGQDIRAETVERISKINRAHTYINTIEFGAGSGTPNSMMRRLAEENNGNAVYVDTKSLRRE